MRIGEITFKRRYSAAQIIVDIASVAALVYLGYIIYACAADIERLKSLNRTNADMSMFDWKPLILWAAVGAGVFVLSFVLIFRKKKQPKHHTVTQNNAVRYCNVLDTGVSCVRLMLIILISEICYIHGAAIRMAKIDFSMQLIVDPIIIVGIIILTKMRLDAVSETELEKIEDQGKKRELIED